MTAINDEYDSRAFKSFKQYKKWKQKTQSEENNRNNNLMIEERYFTCHYCDKINLISDVMKEESENHCIRAKYSTWKKLKDVSNKMGGPIESGLLHLLLLYEDKESHGGQSEYDIQVAANFGGDKK